MFLICFFVVLASVLIPEKQLITWFTQQLSTLIERIPNPFDSISPVKRKQRARLKRAHLALARQLAPPRTRLRYQNYSHAIAVALSTIAMPATAYTEAYAATLLNQQHTARFDTDSAPIGVDNRCSGCISHEISDFLDDLRPSNRVIKGFGGARTVNVMTGTLRWQWADDTGAVSTFTIPKSFYVPHGKVRLLSPQHWAQSQNDFKPIQGTREITDAHNVTLYWKQRKHKLTIPLSGDTNVATFYLAPGYKQFHAFCAEADLQGNYIDDRDPLIAATTGIVSDDDDSSDDEAEHSNAQLDTRTWTQSDPGGAHVVDFTLDGPTTPNERWRK